jgi:hypothetical protein
VATEANQVVASSFSGALAHFRRRSIDIKMGMVLLAGGLVGSAVGVQVFRYLREIGQVELLVTLSYVVFLGIIGSLMFVESLNALRRQLPYLQRLARHHMVVPIFFLNTEIDEDLRRKPRDTEEIYVHTIAAKTVHEKQLIARELERHGMPAILCRPDDLTVSVINRYLEIKARGIL